jgi:hypothetical protein
MPNTLDPELMTAKERLAEVASLLARGRLGRGCGRQESARKALLFLANRVMNEREPEAILAGLPAEIMDGLVEDLADAVVAMLLSTAPAEPGKEGDESGDLRQV